MDSELNLITKFLCHLPINDPEFIRYQEDILIQLYKENKLLDYPNIDNELYKMVHYNNKPVYNLLYLTERLQYEQEIKENIKEEIIANQSFTAAWLYDFYDAHCYHLTEVPMG